MRLSKTLLHISQFVSPKRQYPLFLISIKELAIGVLAEQSLAYSRQCTLLEVLQPGFKGVVDIDLAIAADDEHAACAVEWGE